MRMQKWGQRLLCIAFSLMFLFICTGYAQLADTMTVTGSANYKPPEDYVYISDITLDSASNVTLGETADVFPTTLKNSVIKSGNSTSTIVYKITFKNISRRYTYEFKGIEAPTLDGIDNDMYSTSTTTPNDKFTVSLKKSDKRTNFTTGTSIAPQQEMVVYATYTFGKNVPKGPEFNFLLNYKFGVHVNSMGMMAVEKTLLAFVNALNTPAKYSDLITNIDNKYNNQDWQANYIGNVSQAGSGTASNQAKADAAIVEGLIGSGLTLSIEGITKNVTVLIKRENLDGNERTGDAYKATNGYNSTTGRGCEMTIYMTPNNLNKRIEAGEYAGDAGWAEVFIAVTTCTNNGVISSTTNNYTSMSDWYSLGDIYEGIANIVTYEGNNGNGSFVTDNWKSIQKTYKVTENYSYTIAKDQKIGDIIRATDTKANDEFNRLRNLANAAIQYIDENSDYFGIAEYRQPIQTLRDALAKANAMTVNRNTFRSSLIPILRELENAVYPFQSFIQ